MKHFKFIFIYLLCSSSDGVCTWSRVCLPISIHVEAKGWLWAGFFSITLHFIFWDWLSHWSWSLMLQLDCLASEYIGGSASACPPSQSCAGLHWDLSGCWVSKQVLTTATTLLTEQSPQPPYAQNLMHS